MIKAIVAFSLLATPAIAAPPETVLLHGRIITADAAGSVVQALAISDGKVSAVGSDADIAKLAGPNTRIIDLKGRTATPGLIDTHAHILSTGLGELYEIALGDARSQAVQSKRLVLRCALIQQINRQNVRSLCRHRLLRKGLNPRERVERANALRLLELARSLHCPLADHNNAEAGGAVEALLNREHADVNQTPIQLAVRHRRNTIHHQQLLWILAAQSVNLLLGNPKPDARLVVNNANRFCSIRNLGRPEVSVERVIV
jgi:hypothetical protein